MSRKNHIPVYYINLDESTVRKQGMEKQFKQLGIKATRVPAVDAKKGLAQYAIKKTWKCLFTTEKEYACTLSHLKAISLAYLNDDDVALILEDDMMLLRLPTRKLLSIAPADWDVIQLSASGLSTRKLYENPKYYFTPWRPSYINTGGYLINRRGMVHLLGALAPQVLNNKDLHHVTFEKTDLRWLPLTKACNADYIIYKIIKTYTCCDISMLEDRRYLSTIQKPGLNTYIQDRSAKIIITLFNRRGFLMPW